MPTASAADLLHGLPGQTRERAAVAEPLADRMLDALRALIAGAPLDVLKAAAAARTGAGSLATLVSHLPEADPALAGADPEAAAVARAAEEKRRLLESVATLSARAAAERLGVTAAGVRKARAEGRLLAVEFAGEQRYPAFQFGEAGVRPGVREVLAALAAVPVAGDWARLDFFTAPDAAEDGRSVAALLAAGEVAAAVAAAHAYGEAGA
jgi:hypothetical protein